MRLGRLASAVAVSYAAVAVSPEVANQALLIRSSLRYRSVTKMQGRLLLAYRMVSAMVPSNASRSPVTARLQRSLRLWIFVLILAAPAYSQSLGDIARQERERKREQPTRSTHVYDNDDLARPHILLPEDRERVEASKNKATLASGETSAAAAGDVGNVQKTDTAPGSDAERSGRSLRTSHEESKPLPRLPLSTQGSSSMGFPVLLRRQLPGAPTTARAEHIEKSIPHSENSTGKMTAGVRRVRVEPGDTLWKMACKYLGQGKEWLVLVAQNPQLTNPARIRVGTWIRLPEETKVLPSSEVRIKSGDSLWKLSQIHFGNGREWSCVAGANPQLHNSDKIFPGQELAIPETCPKTSSFPIRSSKASSDLSSTSAQLTRPH